MCRAHYRLLPRITAPHPAPSKDLLTNETSMSTEPETAVADDTADATDLARQLGDTITELPEYNRFEATQKQVQEDDAVQSKIEEFEQIRQEFMLARQTGEATQADLQKVQEAQKELDEQPVMAEFLEAKQALQDKLDELNQIISEPLAVDFGGEAGGCCQD